MFCWRKQYHSLAGEGVVSVSKGRIYSLLSNLWVQIVLTVSLFTYLALSHPEWPSTRVDTWHYFMSSVFQGLSALVGMVLIVGIFFFERLESRLERAKSDCEGAAHELSSTFPAYFDEDTFVDLLLRVRGYMKDHESVVEHAEAHVEKGKEGGPTVEMITRAKEQWATWAKPYSKAVSFYQRWKMLEKKQSVLGKTIRDYFLPMFIPILLSLLFLAFTEYYTNDEFRAAFGMYGVFFLTFLMIVRLVIGIMKGAWSELMATQPPMVDPALASMRISSLGIDQTTSQRMNADKTNK